MDALWVWLRRWRPCAPPVTYAGMTPEQWAEECRERDAQIANLERTIQDRNRTIDRQVIRIEQLEDVIRDMCELRKRVGV